MQRFAITITAEVVRKGVPAKEPDQTVQLSDSILEWRSRETPPVFSLQLKGSFRGAGRTFFDVVSFVELFGRWVRSVRCGR